MSLTDRAEPSAAISKRKAAGLTDDDVALLRLEGRPWPSASSLADLTGVSANVAARRLDRLRQSGVCRPATVMRRDPKHPCECVVYLRIRLTAQAADQALDARLASDGHVARAVRLSGPFDYRLEVRHRDVAAAGAWFRDLLTDPAVAQGTLRITRTVFSRGAGAS